MIYLIAALLFATGQSNDVTCKKVIADVTECQEGNDYDEAACRTACQAEAEPLDSNNCVYAPICGKDISKLPGECMVTCKSKYTCDGDVKIHDETKCLEEGDCFQYINVEIASDGSLDLEWADLWDVSKKDKLVEGKPATCKAKHKIEKSVTGIAYGVCKCDTKGEGQSGFGQYDVAGKCECANTFVMDVYDAKDGTTSCAKDTKDHRKYPGLRSIYLNADCNVVSTGPGETHAAAVNCATDGDLTYKQYAAKTCTGDVVPNAPLAGDGVIGSMDDVTDGTHCAKVKDKDDKDLFFMVDQNCKQTVEGPPADLKAETDGSCDKLVKDEDGSAIDSVCKGDAIVGNCCADGMFKCGQGFVTKQYFKQNDGDKDDGSNCAVEFADYTTCSTPTGGACDKLTVEEKAAHGKCPDDDSAALVMRTFCQNEPDKVTPSPVTPSSSAGRNLAFFGLTLLGLLL